MPKNSIPLVAPGTPFLKYVAGTQLISDCPKMLPSRHPERKPRSRMFGTPWIPVSTGMTERASDREQMLRELLPRQPRHRIHKMDYSAPPSRPCAARCEVMSQRFLPSSQSCARACNEPGFVQHRVCGPGGRPVEFGARNGLDAHSRHSGSPEDFLREVVPRSLS